MASRVFLLFLLMQVPLAAAEIPISSGFPPFLNGLPFQSVSGPEDGEATGTLLEMLSGVTATGKGVIVGIIDTGIDWRHPDFRDPADSLRSRILAIWDTAAELGHPPAGFDYGREWTRGEIEAALRGEGPEPPRDTTHSVAPGHGTYVAGIAAGNGNADPRYRGMAPGAEIAVVVAYGHLQFSLLDGTRYLFAMAERKGRPAVVNFSGTGTGGHELEELLRERPGRAMVASAGNGGESGHCRFDLAETESYTIYKAEEEEVASWDEGLGSELWLTAYHQGRGEAWLGIGLSANELAWRSLRQLADKGFDPQAPPYFTVDFLATESGETRAYLGWLAYSDGEEIHATILVSDRMREPADWIVAAKGSGILHTWSLGKQPVKFHDLLEDPLFKPLDNLYTLSYPSTSPEVISVGAFANRELPEPYDDLPVGDLMPFSSRGPTLEGLLKPDLVAPSVLTAARSGDSTRYRNATARGGGTSASAAVVSGAVALYFERFPDATNREVWRALTGTAASDEFTGETPNLDWGYGKLDVAALLQEPPTVVAAETGEALPSGFSLAQNHPNPFNGRTAISYRLPGPGTVELILYDLLGRPVRRLVSKYQGAGSYRVAWDGTDDRGLAVATGVYLYRLKAGDQQLSRRLLLVR